MAHVLAPFIGSAAWRSAGPLDHTTEIGTAVPAMPAVYVLGAWADDAFAYPGGRAPVFDIEPTRDLQRSLHLIRTFTLEARHARREAIEHALWEYGATFGVRAWWMPAASWSAAKQQRDVTLARFVVRYRAHPVGMAAGLLPGLDHIDPVALVPQR